jgi:DNA gyrase subunit A
MSVIVGRALPDVRDGLKPVHRRILFAMKNLRNTHDKPYKKSARVVGDVIGKYHPHGDVAVYDSIVRMAQDFSMRHPLVDGQGNFGSVDGDAPAAPRYTEVRMTPLAEELLEDLDKETVSFGWNYDDTLLIPQVLPARYPNLLINGSEGIAVGMASRIPPHNLSEVTSACMALIQNPSISDEELMKIVPGPDFPTAGTIKAQAGLISAYKTGKGIITLQAKVEVVQENGKEIIVVHELPYQVNKARLIESIATLVKDKKIEGISDIRDESSREGMRVVIILKKRENADVVLNQLFKHTNLQSRFGIIFLALDSQNQPRLFSLKQMLSSFVEHRFDVVTKRLLFDLRKARQRAHILEGLTKALDSISEVIKMIRSAQDVSEARRQLMERLVLSREQAQSILDMRLQKLTSLERERIFNELKELLKEIEDIQKTLSSEEAIYALIEKELLEIKEKFSSPRKTLIVLGEEDTVEDKDLIPKEDVLVTLNTDGGIKQISLEEYRLQKRGGSGLKGSAPVGDISVWKSLCVNTHSVLLILTDRGRLYWLDAFRIPRMSRTSKGRSIRNLVQLQADEEVQVVIPVDSFSKEGAHLCLITKKGVFKKSSLKLFSKPRKGGVIAVGVDSEDQLVSASISLPEEDIFIVTRKGFCIRFAEKSVRSIGRTARGVRGISLRKGDAVISMDNVDKNSETSYLTVTEEGYGKRTPLKECRSQNRGGMGITAHKVTDKTGEVVCSHLVEGFHQLLVMTNQGQSIRFSCQEISVIGRSAQGVRLMKLKTGEKVRSASLLNEEVSSN